MLVLAAVTAVIASDFLFRSAQESKLATRSLYQSVALNLAEAGLEEALHGFNSQALTAGNGWASINGTTSSYSKTITSGLEFQQAAGAIYMRIDNADTGAPTITATGVVNIPNQPKLLKQLRISGTGPAKIWANGIVARGAVTFSGSADIDSYDSALGTWNATTNRGDRATVASASTVQVTDSAYIYGYVATAGAWPNVGGSGRIYGATSPSTPLVDPSRVRQDFNTNLTNATAPTGTAYSLGASSVGGSSVSYLPRVGDLPGPNGRYLYTCTSISVSGSAYIAIRGPVDVICTGTTTVSDSAYIAIGGGVSVNPSLNFYSAGTINLGGAAMINNTNTPHNLAIWGTKASGTQSITVSGSSAFKGTIYAPNADIAISASGGVYGAIIGHNVTLSGSAVVHYDVRLAQLTSSGGPTPNAGAGSTGYLRVKSWAELTDLPDSGKPFARDNRVPFTALF